jgi:hypothetical protein
MNVPRIHDKVLCALDSDTADQQSSKPNQQEVLTKENLLTLLI